jgi:hypothetical protein
MWQISFDDIYEKWPLSAGLLSLMSYCDQQKNSEEVLKVRLREEKLRNLTRLNQDNVADGEKNED